jgi:hypothetical protein
MTWLDLLLFGAFNCLQNEWEVLSHSLLIREFLFLVLFLKVRIDLDGLEAVLVGGLKED